MSIPVIEKHHFDRAEEWVNEHYPELWRDALAYNGKVAETACEIAELDAATDEV